MGRTKMGGESTGFSRREFVVTGLATGFALAVRPAAGRAVATDTAGLEAAEVEIPASGGSMPAYRARPSGPGPFPVVLVVHEIFGVHEHIQDVCRRFAKRGYLAIAPELYARQGDVSKIAEIREIVDRVVSKVSDEQVFDDLDATAAWAASNHGDPGRLAVTGFCWGGRIVWLYAARNTKLRAGVAWYGRLAGEGDALRPRHPIDVAAALSVPVLGLYGGQDAGIPADSVERMRTAIAAGTSGSEIVVYPEAPHGFFADYRESYRRGPAEDGWKRCFDWFARHGVA